MSGDLKYTERDLVLAKREGWIACDNEFCSDPRTDCERSARMAAKQYPLPKIVRLREIQDPHTLNVWWRRGDVGGYFGIEGRQGDGEWRHYPHHFDEGIYPTKSRCAVWLDLFTTPTEEIDDDGSAPHLLGRDANG